MLNKLPLLVIVLVVIFVITSLMAYITLEKVVTPEKIEPKTSTVGAVVKISIINPEKEEAESGKDIK